jgi:hypothetical protein
MMASKASQEGSWIESLPSSSEPTAVVAGNDSVLVRSKVAGEPTSSRMREVPVGRDAFLEEEEAAEEEAPPRLLFDFDFELDLPPRRPLFDLPPIIVNTMEYIQILRRIRDAMTLLLSRAVSKGMTTNPDSKQKVCC